METMMTSAASVLGGGLHLLSDSGEAFDPLKVGEWPLYFWTVIVFVLLLAILTKIAWKPLMKTISDREETIANDLKSAEDARKEAEESRAKHRKEMEEAAQSAKALLDEARTRASTLQADLERDARNQAESLIAKAKEQIEAEKLSAMQDIRDQVVDLSVDITKRIIDKSVDREDYLSLADQLIPQVKDLS